jgi:hypothetical protein
MHTTYLLLSGTHRQELTIASHHPELPHHALATQALSGQLDREFRLRLRVASLHDVARLLFASALHLTTAFVC